MYLFAIICSGGDSMTERRDIINVKTKVPSWTGMNPKDVSSIKKAKKEHFLLKTAVLHSLKSEKK